jgi:hypothetical protein
VKKEMIAISSLKVVPTGIAGAVMREVYNFKSNSCNYSWCVIRSFDRNWWSMLGKQANFINAGHSARPQFVLDRILMKVYAFQESKR